MSKIVPKLKKVPYRNKNDKPIKIMDPVHNFIDISEYPVIQQLIDTPYFQRLRRLHQLGLTSTVYPNATHSRFAHSIGVMHVFLILFDSVVKRSNLTKTRIDNLRPVGAVAALLHDIGHGPFSHASEKFLDGGKFNHENMTQNIILNTEIKSILEKNNIFPKHVCNILNHEVAGDFLFISQLISSQLDADRLDYLMRDALFTGVTYGKIDIYRIANTLSIWNENKPKKSLKGTITVSQKGIEAIENYLIGRYHMYKGVYYHKSGRCMENILINIFKRALTLPKKYTKIIDIGKEISPKMILTLDDHTCYYAILDWTKASDKILRDLSLRLINRKLLKSQQIDPDTMQKLDQLEDIKKQLRKLRFDPDYYFIQDSVPESGYAPYTAAAPDDGQTAISHIMVFMNNGDLKEITQVSPLVRAISEEKRSTRIFFPQELLTCGERIFDRMIK